MSFIKKSILFALIFSICISIVYAASFDVEVVPVKSKIVIEEFATFKLNIKNNEAQRDEYRIYTLEFPTWDVRTEPISNPITLEVGPKSEGSIEVVVDPLKIKDIGTYQVNVNVRSKLSDKAIPVPLKVTILSTQALIQGYIPTVVTSVGIQEKIDPREEVPIKIVLNNQNIIDYPDLVIKLESNLIKDTIETQLGPKEEKTLELTATLDPLTDPQEDDLVVAVFKGEKSIINPIVKRIEVVEYIQQEFVKEDKKFLVTKSYYDFTSNNKEYDGKFKIETTLLGSIFSSTSPKTKTVKEDGKRYFVGGVELVNNKMQIAVTKNFIPLVVVIILLITVIIAYYMFRPPLLMLKEASNIVKKEGGISEMTIVLHIRNRSQNRIKEIVVTELVPALVSVEKEGVIGSPQPTKVLKHEKKGTIIVKWIINNLDASEERVLSYKVKSRLLILGSFNLPPANAIFESNNKAFTSTSNSLSVSN